MIITGAAAVYQQAKFCKKNFNLIHSLLSSLTTLTSILITGTPYGGFLTSTFQLKV